MKSEKRKRLAALGGLSGAAYLASHYVAPGAPDFLLGLLAGLSITTLITGLLPAAAWQKLRGWKRRGE